MPEKPATTGLQRLATWLFVLPPMVAYARWPTNEYLSFHAGIYALGSFGLVLTIAAFTRREPARSYMMITVVGLALLALLVGYAAAWPTIGRYAYAEPSTRLAFAAFAYCVAAVAFARIAYQEQLLLDVFWKAGLTLVCVGMTAYVANALTGSALFVHLQYGTPRLQGMLSEPSGWAPYLPALFLIALQRRRYGWAGLFAVAGACTKSPTVILTFAIAVPVYYLLRDRRPLRRAIVLAGILGLGVAVVAPAQQFLPRTLSAGYDQSITRLMDGISNITSGGTAGSNFRFTATQAVIHELARHGWLPLGIGPGSEGYMYQTLGVLPYSLPIYVLASFGIAGLAVLIWMTGRALLRMRATPALMLFVPYIVASSINSASGWEIYKYVILAIVVFAGTRARPTPAEPLAAPIPRHATEPARGDAIGRLK